MPISITALGILLGLCCSLVLVTGLLIARYLHLRSRRKQVNLDQHYSAIGAVKVIPKLKLESCTQPAFTTEKPQSPTSPLRKVCTSPRPDDVFSIISEGYEPGRKGSNDSVSQGADGTIKSHDTVERRKSNESDARRSDTSSSIRSRLSSYESLRSARTDSVTSRSMVPPRERTDSGGARSIAPPRERTDSGGARSAFHTRERTDSGGTSRFGASSRERTDSGGDDRKSMERERSQSASSHSAAAAQRRRASEASYVSSGTYPGSNESRRSIDRRKSGDRRSSSATRTRSESLSDPVIGTLDIDLYRRKQDVISQTLDEPALGKLHFRLRYDFDKSDFVVHLIEAHNLWTGDKEGFNDPYVEIILHPETDRKLRRSSIQRKTVFPVYNEVFKFPLTHEELKEKTLFFYIYDFDKFSRDDVVGEVRVDLKNVDVTSDLEVWSDIQKHTRVRDGVGELLFSLSYLPSADRLTIVVMKGKDLKSADGTQQGCDPFVKVMMSVEGRKVKKKKTTVRRNTFNPVWNESIAFVVPQDQLQKASVQVVVYKHDLLGNNEILGHCNVGSKEPGKGGKHWTDMMHNFRKAVAHWHELNH